MSTSTPAAQDRLAGEWNYSATHSSASFSVKYLVASFRGGFEEVHATLVDGKLSGSVPVTSISVKDENLVAHLLAPDFFDAERHPDITFESSSIEIDGDEAKIEGEITIKGVTKPLSATGTVQGPTEDFMGNTRLGFAFETTIDRTEFGVDWNAPLPKGGFALGNDVTLTVELEFGRS